LSAPRRGAARRELETRLDSAIAPFDTIGLLDRSRRDWYPVLAEDLVKSAGKLGATRAEIEDLLERSAFSKPT
jgi:FADH2 O2-dependent halogenase